MLLKYGKVYWFVPKASTLWSPPGPISHCHPNWKRE